LSISLIFSFFKSSARSLLFFLCVCFCLCIFFSQILHNHRGGMFLNFFFEIFSAAHFFVCKFFFEKKRCRTTTPHQFFVFFIMTMKTSSIILCFFLMIEPLTLNCAYFRKKRVFCYVFWALEGSRYFL